MSENPRANILLVDDRRDNLMALAEVLQPLGQNLVFARSGDEALKRLLGGDFACILLDVQMPNLDGFETAAHIKQRERSRHIPIIFLTAISREPHQALKGYSAGAVDYLSKPFDPWILRSKVAVFVDLYLERKRAQAAERALLHQAFHDTLTGLPNRVLFLDRLGQALARRERRPMEVAVLFLDVDRFKWVNDSLGHAAGDQLLVAVAGRLHSVLRPGDTVARFGGDEFVLLCEELGDEREAFAVAQRLNRALADPFHLKGREVGLTASIGIALASTSTHDTPDALLRDADAAMYRAKERGRDRIELFDEDMRSRALSRLETESALRRAIDQGELRVHYQPVIELATGRVTGLEALVRWQHPERGLMPPSEFIPVAEETGLIVACGAVVLTEACTQVARWNAQQIHRPPLPVSVNLSPHQVLSQGLPELVADALERSGLDPRLLCLEITETVLIEDAASSRAALDALKELGVTLAVDDFGTGYSSLLYLRRFPVDVLKIDRSFVVGLGTNVEDTAIVAGVIRLAHALGLLAVAEGVETPEQAARLKELGCDLAQGYYWSRPLAPEETEQWLEAYDVHSRSPGPTTRVLIVDDDCRLREIVGLALQFDGSFEVVAEAADGAEAIERARLHQPDLVLLDLVMPGMGGVDALPHILGAAPETKVVVFTAFDPGELSGGPIPGVAGCFEKSLDLPLVVGQLADLMRSKA
jgi:diguanylate cyclase (GGDEF)-like protein